MYFDMFMFLYNGVMFCGNVQRLMWLNMDVLPVRRFSPAVRSASFSLNCKSEATGPMHTNGSLK